MSVLGSWVPRTGPGDGDEDGQGRRGRLRTGIAIWWDGGRGVVVISAVGGTAAKGNVRACVVFAFKAFARRARNVHACLPNFQAAGGSSPRCRHYHVVKPAAVCIKRVSFFSDQDRDDLFRRPEYNVPSLFARPGSLLCAKEIVRSAARSLINS